MTDKKNATGGQPVAGTAGHYTELDTPIVAQSIPDDKTREFLAHLHRGGSWAYYWTPDGDEFIDKKGKPQRRNETIWYPTKRGQRLPTHWADRRNCYFGVHPTNESGTPSQRSKINTVSAINCFFAEFDVPKNFPSKQAILDHLDASLAAYRAGVGGFPYPSVIVDSGGGAHAYWILEHTVALTEENRGSIGRVQNAWVDLTGGDPPAKDLARVLRVPGTQNRKPHFAPIFPTVHFVECNMGRAYDLALFEALTYDLRNVPLKPAQHTQDPARGQGGALPSDGEMWEVLFTGPLGEEVRRLHNGDLSGHGGDHSVADYDLCRHLVYILGDDPSAIDRLFRQSALYRDDKWGDRADYGPRTIAKAISDQRKRFDWAAYKTRQEAARVLQDLAQMAQHNTNGNGPPPSPTQTKNFMLTDLGNAERLVHAHGQNVRYVYAWDKWLVWQSGRWAKDETGAIERHAKKTVRSIYAEAAAASSDDTRKSIAKWAAQSENASRIGAMIALAKSEQGVSVAHTELDANPWALNVKNGTVDLRTGQLHPHNRTDLATKQAAANYDPGALCPTWERFLDRVLGADSGLIEFIQRAAGYSLTGDVSEQCLFFMHGNGQNGKSTFTETFLELLGDYAQKAPTEMLMQKHGDRGVPNDIARLPGVRFVAAAEIEQGSRLAESIVKDLTGSDTMSARFMRGEFFDFTPTHKLWMYGNHKPTIRGTDDGIWRRVKLLPFTVKISDSEKDPGLRDKLRAEFAGILAWAVRGCLEWQRLGLGVPSAVQDATAIYRAEMDTFGAFLAECTISDRKAEVKASELYKTFELWSVDNGEKPYSGRAFGLKMAELGFAKVKTRTGAFYQGIGIVTQIP